MKKLMLSGIIITGLLMANPLIVQACDKGASKCEKCAEQASKCKVTKLKKEMKVYWAHQDKLGLSDEQLGKIADIKHTAMKQLIRESAEIKVVEVDVKTAMWADQIDTGALNKLIDKKYEAKAKVSKTYVKALADAQRVLTVEQRAKLKKIKTDQFLGKSGCGDAVCQKCAAKGDGKICPITGKPLDSKGSHKGSMK